MQDEFVNMRSHRIAAAISLTHGKYFAEKMHVQLAEINVSSSCSCGAAGESA